MSPALAQYDALIDLLVEVVVREIENDCAPEAGKPAGRGGSEHELADHMPDLARRQPRDPPAD